MAIQNVQKNIKNYKEFNNTQSLIPTIVFCAGYRREAIEPHLPKMKLILKAFTLSRSLMPSFSLQIQKKESLKLSKLLLCILKVSSYVPLFSKLKKTSYLILPIKMDYGLILKVQTTVNELKRTKHRV